MNMQNRFFKNIKLCTLAFVLTIINAKKIVHVMEQLMTNVFLKYVAENVSNIKTNYLILKENYKKKVSKIWMI